MATVTGSKRLLNVTYDEITLDILDSTGQLKIQSSGSDRFIGETSGAAKMLYGGSVKVATTTSGISVTGVVSATGTVTGTQFTDHSNTAYYLNANGDSRLHDLYVDEYVGHSGDGDTYIRFENNQVTIVAGGTTKFHSGNTYLTTSSTIPYSQLSGTPTIPTSLPANGGNADTVDGKHASDIILDNGTTRIGNMNTLGAQSAKYSWNNVTTGRPASAQANEYGAMLHLNYDGGLAFQQAWDIDQGNLYLRTLNYSTDSGTWYKVWHEGNDGSGSGLHADLLDGQHGSHYLNYNNLTNKPTIPTSLPANGGNADTVDNLHASSFLRSDADDTTSGYISFSNQNDGVQFATVSNSATPANLTSGNRITGGSDYAGLTKLNNIAVQSWFGFSVSPTISGYPVSQGVPAFSVDARNGNTFSAVSMRSPIFYDSNNTARYVNPASTSSMSSINMNNGNLSGVNHITIADPGPTEGISWAGGNGWKIVESPDDLTSNTGGNLQFATASTRRMTISSGGDLTTPTGSVYTARVYDRNNTGYYVDPDGSSYIYNINLAGQAGRFEDKAYVEFYVYGNESTFYPVVIGGASEGYAYKDYSISRRYNWTAPNSWNTSSHKGGLTLTWQHSSDTNWGGNDKEWRVIQFDETYSQVCQGLELARTGGMVVWLRGGGTGGARYRVHSPKGSSTAVTIYDGVTSGTSGGGTHNSSTTFTDGSGANFAAESANTTTRDNRINHRWPVRDRGYLYHNGSAVMLGTGMANGADTYMNFRVMRNSNSTGNRDGMYIGYGNSNSGVTRLFGGGATNNGVYVYSNYSQIYGSTRSPIYYDSDNTSYYLSPNNDSRVARLLVGDGNSYIRIGDEGEGANTSYARMRTNSSGDLYLDAKDGRNIYLSWWTGASARVYSEASAQFPVYYDRNSTAYYLDANSSSTALSLAGNISLLNDKGFTTTGNWLRMTTAHGHIQLGPANTSHAHIYTNLSNFYMNKTLNILGGTQLNQNDARASTFYDKDNTGYYVNPNSTSNVNILNVATLDPAKITQGFQLGDNSGGRLYFGHNATRSYFAPRNSGDTDWAWSREFGFNVTSDYWYVDATLYASGDMRSPVFYDSDNTNYYVNPAATSILNTIRMAAGTVSAPSITFGSDTDLGLFRYGSDSLGITAGGTRRARFGSSIFLESSDVRINEYLYHNGDTDTYIRYTGDRIRMVAGGLTFIDIVEGSTDYLRFTQRGVTIGSNTNPQATLTIDQSSTSTPANGCGTDRSAHIKLENTNTTGSASTCIIFNAKDSGGNMRHGAGIQFKKAIAWSANGQYPGELYFWTRPTSGNQIASLKIDKDGNTICRANITAFGSLSDRRLKDSIEPIDQAVSKVQQLEGVTFKYKKDGKRSTGLIAQDLEKVLPEAVYTTTDIEGTEEHLAIHYGNTVGLLVNAIKEQQQTIDELTKRIEQLETNPNSLKEK